LDSPNSSQIDSSFTIKISSFFVILGFRAIERLLNLDSVVIVGFSLPLKGLVALGL